MPAGFKNFVKEKITSGNEVFCPICNSGFSTFLPFGRIRRANALCPNCNSLERHRLQFLYLANKTDFFKREKKVLHIAPEKCLQEVFRKNKNIEYTAIDKFTDTYVYSSDTINMDITDLRFGENTFDVVLCSHVLEHIPDDAKAMSEIFRVLKKGGFAILQVPLEKNREVTYEDFSITEPGEREKAFGQFDHVRIYGVDYKNRLEKAGFIVTADPYIDTFTKNDSFRYGLMEGEEIYYCQKN